MPLRRPTSLAVVLLALTARAGFPAGLPAAPAALPAIDAGTTLLVISPHPDDETLCCAGVIQRVLHAGGRASVVWITSGDGSELGMLFIEKTLFDVRKMRAFGAARMREARAASALLGVAPAGQLFLGYPDGGVSALLAQNHDSPYTSRFTAAAAVPYPDALFPGHPYTGASLERDLDAVLERVHPTLILAPSPLDEHPDHRAAGLMTITVSRRRGAAGAVRFWLVHGGEGWPSPRGLLMGVPLDPSPRGRELAPLPFVLNPAEEDRKLSAVRAYETQMKLTQPFLLSFVRTTELFSGRATDAAAQP